MSKIDFILLFVLFIVAAGLRLYGLNNPVADWHSWRQADTAAVARNFTKFGLDPLHPRYDDLSNIQSGKDNPQGWRMVEFPLYQVVGVLFHRARPQIPIEINLKLLSIILSAGTAIFLASIVWHLVDRRTGYAAGFLYAVLPFSVYFGRTILPDVPMVFWAVASIFFLTFTMDARGKRVWILILLASTSGAFALLSKPMAAFLLLPVPYLIFRKFRFSKETVCAFLLYGLCLLPILWWRNWIMQFPEGIPASDWLFNAGNIRFTGAWFHWLFATRLGDLILGFWLLVPFGIGIAQAVSVKEGWAFRLFALGGLLYFIVIARGNVQHDYYQILILPIVAVYTAKGLVYLLMHRDGAGRISAPVTAIICVMFGLAFSWFTIRTYWWINRPEIVEAGRMADQILPKDAKVIAPYNGDTTFLYQTNRQGWPLGFDIDKKIKMGATAYVTVSPTDNDGETRALASRFAVLIRNDRYAIIDLTKPKK